MMINLRAVGLNLLLMFVHLGFVLGPAVFAADPMPQPPDTLVVPPAPVLKPNAALKSFVVADDFVVEIVAAEPLVEDPICCAFDGDGRIWVCEMRGFMPDVSGKGEDEKNGRVVILEDTNDDGRMDKSTVFLDGIWLPRAISLVKGGILLSDQRKLYFVPNRDGKAGKPIVVDAGYSRGNLEHSANGLMPGLDNWIYSANTDKRYRLIDGRWVTQKTEGRGQWGITQDNYGRLITNGNSNVMRYETLPPNYSVRNPRSRFSLPILSTSGRVNPIRPTPGTNRAYKLRGDYVLRSVTAACGMSCYRGDNFPPEYHGNVFTPAPAVNLVTRTVVKEENGKFSTVRKNDPEFLASTDERSRIVNSYTAPDGTLYLVDLYRGILQHKVYLTPYLKEQIRRRDLDKPIGLGRIYRVRHRETPAGPQPKMSRQTSQQLVAHLEHPNGWWRDTAQRILVERGDRSAVAALEKLAATSDNHLGRIHALWTLEGLQAVKVETLSVASQLDHPKLLANVIRVGETLADSAQAEATVKLLKSIAKNDDGDVQMQLALSLGRFRGTSQEAALSLLHDVIVANPKNDLLQRAAASGLYDSELAMLRKVWGSDTKIIDSLIAGVLQTKDKAAIAALLSLIDAKNTDAELRQRALQSMAGAAIATRDAHAVQLVFDRASTTDDESKLAIAKAMVQSRGKNYRVIPLVGSPKELTAWQNSDDKELRQQATSVAKLFDLTGKPPVNYINTPEEKAQYAAGRRHYENYCMGCHMRNGEGATTKGPPLAGSEWVLEDARRAIAIGLNGVWGPIRVNGHVYKEPEILPLMPGLRTNPTVKDEELAAVMTYIRNSWGNHAPAVSANEVTAIREATKDFETPFSEADLKDFDKTLERIANGEVRRSLESELLKESVADLIKAASSDGDPERGEQILADQRLSCRRCHSVAGVGPNLGPDLARLDAKLADTHIVESILHPSKVVAKGYESVAVYTVDGRNISGLRAEENDDRIVIRDVTKNGQRITVKRDDIDEVVDLVSFMPKGLANELRDRQEFLDLVSYLMKLKKQQQK